MVYCKLKSIENGRALYDYGADVNDMTGIIEVLQDGTPPKILRKPNNGSVRLAHIFAAYNKKKDKILRGDFPDKLSFEN